ncbi:MAG: recombinase family protein [Acidimicrobiia bacterium]|nr:recombinase family protein [Acidimicrobiia bacterium]
MDLAGTQTPWYPRGLPPARTTTNVETRGRPAMSTAEATPSNTKAGTRGAYERSTPPPHLAMSPATSRAVVYLRVSSAGQVHTDRDAEGLSIPAQREACYRKAEAIGAQVVEEYVDAGESARQSDRPALQRMLLRLTEERDIDFVIVHKVDRLARNRADDVSINVAIRESNAALVSVTENIDETPSGTLLHGIMASISEFYSKNLALEVSKGMDQKAKKGGRPGKAPVGYLNSRETSEDGHEVRTIVVHPDHGDHVRWAFEAYATGDYTIRTLTEALKERGLRTQHSRKQPPKAMNPSKVAYMLRNVFYVGIVEWKGEQHPGRHEPLVTPETWAKVQAILNERDQAGERQRKNQHYLKGSVFCARCRRRLGFLVATGRNGGMYDYFFCYGRQSKNGCDLPFLATEEVEEAVARAYSDLELGADLAEEVRDQLLSALKRSTASLERERASQQKRVKQLENERRRLVRAHLEGAVPVDLLKEEQDRITKEIAQAQDQLRATDVDWDTVETNLTLALGLVSDCTQAYRRGGPRVRRRYNQAFLDAIYVR